MLFIGTLWSFYVQGTRIPFSLKQSLRKLCGLKKDYFSGKRRIILMSEVEYELMPTCMGEFQKNVM
jgi:hypothetical protein